MPGSWVQGLLKKKVNSRMAPIGSREKAAWILLSTFFLPTFILRIFFTVLKKRVDGVY